jgi:hypothetical protein
MGSSLITRAADATSGVAVRSPEPAPEASAGFEVGTPRGITPRQNPPARRLERPAAPEPVARRLAEAVADGPRPATRERSWWRRLGGGR